MAKIFFAVLTVAAMLPGVAAAQSLSNSIYGELRGGASFLTDSELDAGGGAKADLEFDTGWLVEGAVGYAHESGFRGEVALGYRRNNNDELEGFGEQDGHFSAFNTMANAYYDINLGKMGAEGFAANITPFIGGGIGFAVLELDDGDADDTSTQFAYQGVAGVSYAFTPNWSASVRYAYFGTTEGSFDSIDADYNSHNAIAGIRYNF